MAVNALPILKETSIQIDGRISQRYSLLWTIYRLSRLSWYLVLARGLDLMSLYSLWKILCFTLMKIVVSKRIKQTKTHKNELTFALIITLANIIKHIQERYKTVLWCLDLEYIVGTLVKVTSQTATHSVTSFIPVTHTPLSNINGPHIHGVQ